ncbi:MAG: hypothetical protein ABL958_01185 [Bdellovibrionia bacterium]
MSTGPSIWIRIYVASAFFLVLSLGAQAFAAPAAEDLPKDPDAREGYIQTLGEETDDTISDVVLVPKPPPQSSIPLSDVIWDIRLKKEFIERYREKFGYTEVERNLGLPILYSENGIAQGRSVESGAARAERRAFADYMFRRLAEHHMDSYFRSDPSLKSVWELKERISNVEVKVTENFSFMTIYSYSGNFVTIVANNPYVNVRLRLEMNPASFGPSELIEGTISLEKQVTRTLNLQSHYRYKDGILTLVGSKAIAPAMSATLTGSVDSNSEGTQPQQNLVLAGFAFIY